MLQLDRTISKANEFVMPAVNDYLAARCLLLNNIFVGLTLAHEAVEKMMKALLILENIKPPKTHELTKLSKLLIKIPKYHFLKKSKYLKTLDLHYGWRYLDDSVNKRSQTQSIGELHGVDSLWVMLYEYYMNYLPEGHRYRTYLIADLFMPTIQKYTNWSQLLFENNRSLKIRRREWERGFKKWYYSTNKN